MTSLFLSPLSLSSNPFPFSNFKPFHTNYHLSKELTKRRIRNGKCRAELSQDAPFAVAIGACILNSLVFPVPSGPHDEEGESVIDSADARFVVMGIISFIPYFNWMSWVFAWLDTGKLRYAVYAIVYFAPYMRSNLSISPEESWLPIASIIFCIIHIQLEASIKNGDLQGFQLFNEVSRQFYQKKDVTISEQVRIKKVKDLLSAQDELRNEVQGWGVPRKPSQDSDQLDEEGEAGKRH